MNVGDIVLIMLNEQLVERSHYLRGRVARDNLYAYFGARAKVGDTLPMIVTKINVDDTVNGQIIADADFSLFVDNVHRGPGAGQYLPRL